MTLGSSLSLFHSVGHENVLTCQSFPPPPQYLAFQLLAALTIRTSRAELAPQPCVTCTDMTFPSSTRRTTSESTPPLYTRALFNLQSSHEPDTGVRRVIFVMNTNSDKVCTQNTDDNKLCGAGVLRSCLTPSFRLQLSRDSLLAAVFISYVNSYFRRPVSVSHVYSCLYQ